MNRKSADGHDSLRKPMLTVVELREAEREIIGLVQTESFPGIIQYLEKSDGNQAKMTVQMRK